MVQPNLHLLEIVRDEENMAGRENFVCLDRNERHSQFPDEIFKAMQSALTPDMLNHYPDPDPLYDRLCMALGFERDWIKITAGSDAAIRKILQTFLEPGSTLLTTRPTYAMYEVYCAIFQAQVECLDYDNSLELDLDRLLERISKKPKVIALANPNQPTGTVIDASAMRDIVTAAYDVDALVLIDEAYYPFHPETSLPMAKEFSNVVITRSFSKAAGLAGMRLGYFVANPEIISHVEKVRGAHEVNEMAITVGAYLVDHQEVMEDYIREAEAGREILRQAADELGLGFPSCPTNFQLLRIPGVDDSAQIVERIKELGYLIKAGYPGSGLQNTIRITLASPEIMQGFVGVLKQALSEQA